MSNPSPAAENAEIARSYIEAIGNRDLDKACALWAPGATDDLVGIAVLTAPDGVREYFGGFLAAAPDADFEILSVTADDERAAVHWRMWGTFDGTGKVLGLSPNGRRFDVRGTDLLTIKDGRIQHNTAISNAMDFARQLALLPPAESRTEKALFGLVNLTAPSARAIRRRRRTRSRK